MNPKISIRSYRKIAEPIRETITKFSGQPVWLNEPAWPISVGWEIPMRFICQIRLDFMLFGEGTAKVAYLFLTHAGRDEIENGAFDPDIIFADSGENAVILQPAGRVLVDTEPLAKGPSLVHLRRRAL